MEGKPSGLAVVPANIGEIENRQTNVILVACNTQIVFQTENLCIPYVGAV